MTLSLMETSQDLTATQKNVILYVSPQVSYEFLKVSDSILPITFCVVIL